MTVPVQPQWQGRRCHTRTGRPGSRGTGGVGMGNAQAAACGGVEPETPRTLIVRCPCWLPRALSCSVERRAPACGLIKLRAGVMRAGIQDGQQVLRVHRPAWHGAGASLLLVVGLTDSLPRPDWSRRASAAHEHSHHAWCVQRHEVITHSHRSHDAALRPAPGPALHHAPFLHVCVRVPVCLANARVHIAASTRTEVQAARPRARCV